MIKKIAAAATAGTIAWAGISAIDNTTRDNSGQITAAGDLGVFVTKVGDCLNGITKSKLEVDVVKGVPCTEAHHWQVIHKGNLDFNEYSEIAVSQGVDAICNPVFDNLSNSISEQKFLEYQNAKTQSLFPTAESWAHEDRVVDCLVGSYEETYYTSLFE